MGCEKGHIECVLRIDRGALEYLSSKFHADLPLKFKTNHKTKTVTSLLHSSDMRSIDPIAIAFASHHETIAIAMLRMNPIALTAALKKVIMLVI